MSTPHDDPPGSRSIRLEVEVPGTPEEVWEAIATGRGITAWFVPTEVAEHEGGAMRLHFGPGMDESARVTVWEPLHRFVYETPESRDRRLAYEWLVEARGEGICAVRLINSGFGTEADWDGEYHSMDGGWRLFLYNLRLYRTHFPGQRCSSIIVNGNAVGPVAQAWAALTAALGLPPAVEGQRVSATAPGAPPLAGVAERVVDGMLTLLLDTPAPGIAFLAAESPDGGLVHTSFYGYLFSDEAPAVVARDEPAWRAWMERNFPPAGAPTEEAPAG